METAIEILLIDLVTIGGFIWQGMVMNDNENRMIIPMSISVIMFVGILIRGGYSNFN